MSKQKLTTKEYVVPFTLISSLFFFMSIMFPSIFALGIKDLGPKTKKASSIIVMSIVGGALFPPVMGWIANISSMLVGFYAPIPFFCVHPLLCPLRLQNNF